MKTQRLLSILTLLLREKKVNAKDLAEKFGVSTRTIYRDINVLEESGIPIVTFAGVNGGIGILEDYKLDKNVFTNDEISTLLMSLNILMTSIDNPDWTYTLEKIKHLIPTDKTDAIELSSQKFHIDMTPWASSAHFMTTYDTLKSALVTNHLLKLTYCGRNNLPTERIVEPHQLVLKENNWYLRAYCQEKKDFRIFKLIRIQEIEQLDASFVPREFDTVMNDFKEWKSPLLKTIELIIEPELKTRLLDYCREDTMTDLPNGKIHIDFPFVASDLGYGILLSLGDKCECIAPSDIRKELHRRILDVERIYRNEND